MKVLTTDTDRHCCCALALYLTNKGRNVVGVDNFSRRKNEVGPWSASHIQTMGERLKAFKEVHGKFRVL